jgi:hypothetical protein
MISLFIAVAIGFVVGLLVARNNVDRTESVVARGKKLLDALKGR